MDVRRKHFEMADAKSLIRSTIEMSSNVVKAYINDLSDEDMRFQPIDGMNSIAKQIGHLIVSERQFVEAVAPGSSPALPDGFTEAHDLRQETSAALLTKAEYLELWEAQRKSTLAVLEALPNDQLDRSTGFSYAPTVAVALNTIGGHALMHSGQFAAVRRALKKPVAI